MCVHAQVPPYAYADRGQLAGTGSFLPTKWLFLGIRHMWQVHLVRPQTTWEHLSTSSDMTELCRWVATGVIGGHGHVPLWRGGVAHTIPAELSDLSHPLSTPALGFLPSSKGYLFSALLASSGWGVTWEPGSGGAQDTRRCQRSTSNVSPFPPSPGQPSGSQSFGSCAFNGLLPRILCSPCDLDLCLL